RLLRVYGFAAQVMKKPLRVGVICDFLEENWPSMDLVGETLFSKLRSDQGRDFESTLVRPAFKRVFSASQRLRANRRAFNADRALNRYILYPRLIRRIHDRFDLFHVIDHSYAHLVRELPGLRTVVTCHDADLFEPLMRGGRTPRSASCRALARHVLSGFS